MPENLTVPMQSLLVGGVKCFATLWEITRADGTIYRFTDHNRSIPFEGQTFTPVAFRPSAREREAGLSAPNMQVVGPIDNGAITNEDLRAGRFRRARVREIIVDWRCPWAGKFRENVYIISEVRYTGEYWDAHLEGILALLAVKVGYNYERKCRWQRLGDTNCQADLTGKTQTGRAVMSVIDARRQFESNIATGRGDGYFDQGKVEWTSGSNAGVISDVKEYVELDGVVTLQVEVPFDIEPGDEFDIVPGCDRRFSTCKTKFQNAVRFGGFPYIPGNHDFLKTPDAQQQ